MEHVDKINYREISDREISELVFKKWFGDAFELTWTERVALQNYIDSFSNISRSIIPISEAGYHFLKNYFDIDLFELNRHEFQKL